MLFRNRLTLTFGLFIVVICLCFAVLLSESLNQLEDHLVESLLQQEAHYLKQRYLQNPAQFSLPDLEQLKGYISGSENLPAWLVAFKPGHHDDADYQVYIIELEPELFLYLHYDETKGILDHKELEINLAIAAMVIIVMLIGFGLAWNQAGRLAAPVLQLASQISETRADRLETDLVERDDEIGQLSQSHSDLMARINDFIQREQAFTRHASHELATPLAIMRSNLELVKQPGVDDAMYNRAISRMEQALERMQRQIQIFLLLAREDRLQKTDKPLDIRQILDELRQDHPAIELEKAIERYPELYVDPDLLHTVLQNIFSNIEHHGLEQEGCYRARLQLDSAALRVSNSFETSAKGSGFGLGINKKLCAAAGWQFDYRIDDDRFTAIVRFDKASTH